MTFELSADHLSVRDRARALAATARSRSAEIERTREVAADLVHAARAVCHSDPLGVVVAVEELAVASAALALAGASTEASASSVQLNGLRGAPMLRDEPRSQLVLAAVALGIGRSALDEALRELRRAMATADTEVEKPHWAVADVATDLDAARLLTYKAARSTSEADIAVARLMASAAATRAVDTALRVFGADALSEGSMLERLSRDVRAAALLLGSEERQRAIAADGLLPQST